MHNAISGLVNVDFLLFGSLHGKFSGHQTGLKRSWPHLESLVPFKKLVFTDISPLNRNSKMNECLLLKSFDLSSGPHLLYF